jgi:hypothetical protein
LKTTAGSQPLRQTASTGITKAVTATAILIKSAWNVFNMNSSVGDGNLFEVLDVARNSYAKGSRGVGRGKKNWFSYRGLLSFEIYKNTNFEVSTAVDIILSSAVLSHRAVFEMDINVSNGSCHKYVAPFLLARTRDFPSPSPVL